jgi:hypothetical protein
LTGILLAALHARLHRNFGEVEQNGRVCGRWGLLVGYLLPQYPEVDWKKAMGMRDIITHHYADLHAETVFYTCKRKIPPLLETVRKIIQDLQ